MHCRISVASAVAIGLALLLTPSVAFADSKQWYLEGFGIEKVHKLSQGEGVKIGVIDTGVDGSHADLEGQVDKGTGFNGGAEDGLTDKYDHGTGIASIIAGNGSSDGILGIAPKATIIPVAVCDSKCDRTEQGIRDGIQWLVKQDVDIISISMGSDPAEQDTIDEAVANGIPIVASAGNLRVNSKDLGEIEIKGTSWPATAKGVIPVTGTTPNNEFWDGSSDLVGSSQQPKLGISAPATDIPAAKSGGGYATHSGTSGSAPIVAGTLALIKSAYPQLSYFQWIDRLLDTVDDKGPKDFDDQFGWGIVNPYRALTEETTYEGKDGDQVSSPDDRLSLAEQGKSVSGNNDDDDSSSDNSGPLLNGSPSAPWLYAGGITLSAFVLVAVTATVIVLIKRRRSARNYEAPGNG